MLRQRGIDGFVCHGSVSRVALLARGDRTAHRAVAHDLNPGATRRFEADDAPGDGEARGGFVPRRKGRAMMSSSGNGSGTTGKSAGGVLRSVRLRPTRLRIARRVRPMRFLLMALIGVVASACRGPGPRATPVAVAAPTARARPTSSPVDPLLSEEAGHMAVEDQHRAAASMKRSPSKPDRRDPPVRTPLRHP